MRNAPGHDIVSSMKWYATVLAVGLAWAPLPGIAETPVELKDIPAPVTAALESYFPGSKAVSAKRDDEDGKVEYEVRIAYKDLQLDVDLAADGKILDVDKEP